MSSVQVMFRRRDRLGRIEVADEHEFDCGFRVGVFRRMENVRMTTLDGVSPRKESNEDRSAEAAAAAELVRPAKEQAWR